MISNSPDLLDEAMKHQLVSVIIPTHNRPDYLEQAVTSVLNQTHKTIEIIIVDDGSDKRHTEAIQRIAGMNPTIGLHRHETPKGPGYTRNLGLDKATGEFVLFLDDDDLLRPGMVADGLETIPAPSRFRCGRMRCPDLRPIEDVRIRLFG